MSILGPLLHRLFRDLGLKLAAIFLATALYLHVQRESETTVIFRIPLEWKCAIQDPGRGTLPDSASIRVRASAKDMARIRSANLRIRADLCVAEAGSLVFRQFTGPDVVLPDEVRALEVVVLEPASVYARATGGAE